MDPPLSCPIFVRRTKSMGSSCCAHELENIVCNLLSVHVFHQLEKRALERLPCHLMDPAQRIIGQHNSLAQNEQVRTDLLNHFQHVGTIKNNLALLPESLNQVLEN